jgi:hypothetical protein
MSLDVVPNIGAGRRLVRFAFCKKMPTLEAAPIGYGADVIEAAASLPPVSVAAQP